MKIEKIWKGERKMKMTLEQTKLVGLTMELDLKTREYKSLCDKLEEYKSKNIDPNDEKYAILAQDFLKNQKEIKNIMTELRKLK